ncbi:hypothetical protein ACFP81_06410 [Deinococcus lacus]|uniref:Phage head-tail adaptor n=1 Tax=Deinococcus lacus TaxID=392561 RepID=A0ABW1YCH1_9DEIO
MRGILTPYADEQVQIYQTALSEPDALGQFDEVSTLTAERAAHVQPLGSDAAARMGLEGEIVRLRVRFAPPVLISVGDLLRARGRDWRVIRLEPWQSFTTVIVEAV